CVQFDRSGKGCGGEICCLLDFFGRSVFELMVIGFQSDANLLFCGCHVMFPPNSYEIFPAVFHAALSLSPPLGRGGSESSAR
ncbi:MAG: hypothetical protein LUH06_00415, partial [Oscillospiraceae bacterium]|nr:hypothetical protein [Oscillospiraceae bacterium]